MAYGIFRIITTLEFLQHHFAKSGHRDGLLVTHNLSQPTRQPPLPTSREASAARAASFLPTICQSSHLLIPGRRSTRRTWPDGTIKQEFIMSNPNISTPARGRPRLPRSAITQPRNDAIFSNHYPYILCRWRAWRIDLSLGCIRGFTCALYLADCGRRNSLSQSERFKRRSRGNQHGEAHEVLGRIRSQICRASRSM